MRTIDESRGHTRRGKNRTGNIPLIEPNEAARHPEVNQFKGILDLAGLKNSNENVEHPELAHVPSVQIF